MKLKKLNPTSGVFVHMNTELNSEHNLIVGKITEKVWSSELKLSIFIHSTKKLNSKHGLFFHGFFVHMNTELNSRHRHTVGKLTVVLRSQLRTQTQCYRHIHEDPKHKNTELNSELKLGVLNTFTKIST